MNVNGINSVSFGATTKQGNEYKKTNAGKIAGGVGFSAILVHDGIRAKKMGGAEKYLKLFENLAIKEFPGIKNPKRVGNIIFAAGLAVCAAFTFGAGAIVDKVINHVRAKNADKPVMLK